MVATAPIYSLTAEDRARAESDAWAGFSSPKDMAEFSASWLAILCAQIKHVNGALLVLGPDAQGGYSASAVWPDASRDMQYLASAAEKALKERRAVVEREFKERRKNRQPVVTERRGFINPAAGGMLSAHVGYPIEVSGVLRGAVILDIGHSPERELQAALRLVHWASAWLVDQFRQQAFESLEGRLARMSLATDVTATATQGRRFGLSALAVVNELAAKLDCERVSLGFDVAGSVEVQAISHTATFDRKTDLVRHIGSAMDEALDQDATIVYPAPDDEGLGAIAHAELAGTGSAVCSVPLVEHGQTIGILTLERSAAVPFVASDIELCQTIGLLLGPIFRLKRDNERGPVRLMGQSIAGGARMLFGPRHPGLKLIVLTLVGVIAFLSLVSVPYRVAAKTVIEGSVQRAVVAPFDSFIAQGSVRAGETVMKGQVLCRLDDRDLKLEQVRWTAEEAQADRKYRQALSTRDRAAASIMAAQIDQARAQLSLVEEKLSRATLTAPFDGIVVSGDLSQLMGTPVETGKLLFEIAPLDSYRVIFNVDERDISLVIPGQKGELALSGIPYEKIRFEVKLVTPVSTPLEGGNFFRVEAHIEDNPEHLRPGMEGVGKISVGERKLIWIWTHGLVDWLRLWTWKWLP